MLNIKHVCCLTLDYYFFHNSMWTIQWETVTQTVMKRHSIYRVCPNFRPVLCVLCVCIYIFYFGQSTSSDASDRYPCLSDVADFVLALDVYQTMKVAHVFTRGLCRGDFAWTHPEQSTLMENRFSSSPGERIITFSKPTYWYRGMEWCYSENRQCSGSAATTLCRNTVMGEKIIIISLASSWTKIH